MGVADTLTIAFPKEPTVLIDFTDLQGQYLSYIYNYSVIHRRAPSEADFRGFFGTTPPTIHNMILKLETKGLIGRVPGEPRSIRLLIPPQRLPVLRPATWQRP
jgi:DNA-binding MarR family transcriptional regulator